MFARLGMCSREILNLFAGRTAGNTKRKYVSFLHGDSRNVVELS